jgi:hypothetical protein
MSLAGSPAFPLSNSPALIIMGLHMYNPRDIFITTSLRAHLYIFLEF